MSTQKFTGTGVAIATPFREDSSIDFKSLGKLTEYLIKGGVNYIVVLGTTGESVTLNKDEKSAVVNYVTDTVNKRIPVVVGIGGNNTAEVLSCISACNYENIDAILSVAPYYNKPSQEGLYQHFKAIATTSPVPVILYNVPGRTASNISAGTTVRLAKDMKNIIGVKEASGNMTQVMQILRDAPAEFLIISGDDALTLPMITMGGAGVISVIGNAYPKLFSDMVSAALNKDYEKAAKIHFNMLDFIDAMFKEGNPSGIKAALEIKGICSKNVRLPLVPVSKEHYQAIKDLVKKLG